MEQWLDFARGPLFIATFLLMALGLGRLIFLEIYQMVRNWLGMRDRSVPWMENVKLTLQWLVPTPRVLRLKPFLAVISFLFHVGLIVVPIFLAEHILLWKSGLGISWPSLSAGLADFFTLMTIVTCLLLLGHRIFVKPARDVSGFGDYAILVILLIPFVTGYLVMHPRFLFTDMETMLLAHILSGELVFVLVPFTKLAHVVMFPFTRFSSDFYWRFPAEGPRRVAKALHGDEVRI